MSIEVRSTEERDSSDWKDLYSGYRAFYQLADDSAAVDRTWQWVIAGEHSMLGLVAVDDQDIPIAFANLRWFARPSTGTIGLYLDDLFTSQQARGTGAAGALLDRAARVAAEGGASVVRWITADDNVTARRLYDQRALKTPWVTYDMQPSEVDNAR